MKFWAHYMSVEMCIGGADYGQLPDGFQLTCSGQC